MLCGDALDGESDDALGFAVGVFPGGLANLADSVGRVGVRLFLEPLDQFVLGVLGGHPGQLLQLSPLIADELLELLLAGHHDLFLPSELAGALADFLVALLEHVELAIEHAVALLDPFLLALDLFPAAARFHLPRFAELDQLFLARDDSTLPEILGFALGLAQDPLRRLVSGRFRKRLVAPLGALTCPPAKKEESHGGEYY